MEEKKTDSQRKEVGGPSFVIKYQGVPSQTVRGPPENQAKGVLCIELN